MRNDSHAFGVWHDDRRGAGFRAVAMLTAGGVIIASGVLGTPVSTTALALVGFRVYLYLKGRADRERLYRSLDPEVAKQVRAAYRSSYRNNFLRRVIWIIGFLGTLVFSTLLVSRLLGPGIPTVAATIVLWLILWRLFSGITGVGWIWTSQDLVRIVHRRR